MMNIDDINVKMAALLDAMTPEQLERVIVVLDQADAEAEQDLDRDNCLQVQYWTASIRELTYDHIKRRSADTIQR